MSQHWNVVAKFGVALFSAWIASCGGGPATPAREVTRTTETADAIMEETVIEEVPSGAPTGDAGVGSDDAP